MYEDEYAEDIIERYSDMPFIQRVMRDTEDFPKYTSEIMNFGATFQTLSYGPRNSWNAWEAPLRKFFEGGKFELEKEDEKKLKNELAEKEEKETVESAEPIRPIHGMILFFELYKLKRDLIFFKAHSYITHALLYGDGRAGVTFIRNFINNKLGVFGATAALSTPDKPIIKNNKMNIIKPIRVFSSKPENKEFKDGLVNKIGNLYPSYGTFDLFFTGKNALLNTLREKVNEMLQGRVDNYYDYSIAPIVSEWGVDLNGNLNLVKFRLMLLFFISVPELNNKLKKAYDLLQLVNDQFYLDQPTKTVFFYGTKYSETILKIAQSLKVTEFTEAEKEEAYELQKTKRPKSDNNFVKLLLILDRTFAFKNQYTDLKLF